MKKNNAFIYNAFLLIAVSLIMRTVGMYFNVYISNKIGAEAMGIYSLIGGVYGFGITLAASGVNLASTRMVSEAIGRGERHRVGRIMRACILYALAFGLLAAGLLFSLSELISFAWLDDARCVRPLRILALSLPFISVSSALGGYFTAVRRIIKNALTVFLEQGVRILLTVILLTSLMPPGIEYACIALAAGSTAAEVLSLIVMSLLYLIESGKKRSRDTSGASVVKTLLGISLPVAFSSYVRSGLLTLEHALIPAGLKKYGSSGGASLALYGTLHSMVFPVILFPAVFITSFSGLLVPELAESRAAHDNARILRIVQRVIRLTLLFAVGVSGIMLCFADELGSLIYKNSEYAGDFIRALAPLIPVMYLDSMTDVMLKGLGQQFYSMTVNIVDSLLSVLLVWLLVPHYGVYGYVFIIYICELINTSLSVARLLSVTSLRPSLINWLLKPLAAVAGAVSMVKLIISLGDGRYTASSLTWAIITSALIYILLLTGLFALGADDFKKLKGIFSRDGGQPKKT